MATQKSRVEQVKEFCMYVRNNNGTSAVMNDGLELEDMSVQIGGNFYKADVVEAVCTSLSITAKMGALTKNDYFLIELLRDSNILPRP